MHTAGTRDRHWVECVVVCVSTCREGEGVVHIQKGQPRQQGEGVSVCICQERVVHV